MPGEVSRGNITYPGYEHLKWEAVVKTMEPERLFSFTWHPYAVDPKMDYSKEPQTLVEFRLEKTAEGTRADGDGVRLRQDSGGTAAGGLPHERGRLGGADEEHRALSCEQTVSALLTDGAGGRRRLPRWEMRRGWRWWRGYRTGEARSIAELTAGVEADAAGDHEASSGAGARGDGAV